MEGLLSYHSQTNKMIISGISTGILGVNCYIAAISDKDAYIIDAPDHLSLLFKTLKERKLKPIAVLLTHGHYDHILGLGEIREEYPGLDIYLSQEDLYLIKDGCKGNRDLLGRYSPINEYLNNIPEDVKTYEDKLGPFEVLRTPGHTPGSICLYSKEDKVLFSGDTLFNSSVGRTDLGGSYSDMLASIELLKGLEDDVSVLPGHGSYTTMGIEKRENPYF